MRKVLSYAFTVWFALTLTVIIGVVAGRHFSACEPCQPTVNQMTP